MAQKKSPEVRGMPDDVNLGPINLGQFTRSFTQETHLHYMAGSSACHGVRPRTFLCIHHGLVMVGCLEMFGDVWSPLGIMWLSHRR